MEITVIFKGIIMNYIEKDFVTTMQSQGLNYNNVKQVNLVIDSIIDESSRNLRMTKIVDFEKEQFEIRAFMQSITPLEIIRGWVSFDNGGWIERNEALEFDYWEYKICPRLEIK